MSEEEESVRHAKIDEIFTKLYKHNKATNVNETQKEVTKMLKSVSYGLKYDPAMRIDCEPRDFETEVCTQLCHEMNSVIEAQEQIIQKLMTMTDKFTKNRLSRYSITQQPNGNGINSMQNSFCDLSGIQNDSMMDTKVNISDILDYCSEYMITTNKVDAALDNHVNKSNEFTVYEDLLNAFDMD